MAAKTLLLSYWDTEDTLSPPEAGSDDIILEIARSARRAGMSACFHIIGDRARCLAERGRQDIVDELRSHHDVSLHYASGSLHPTTCELVAECGWDEGVAVAWARERLGFRLIEGIFGMCPALTMHGTTYGPQILQAAAREGKAFWQVGVGIPESSAFWFCDCLCFDTRTHGSLDGLFQDDALFQPALDELLTRYRAAHEAGEDIASVCGHPHRTICQEFADVPYYDGRNALHEDLRPPAPYSETERATVRRNIGRMFEALVALEGFETTTVTGLVRGYGVRPATFDLELLGQWAQRVLDEGGPCYLPGLSAADGLLSLAELLVARRGRGWTDPSVPRHRVLGPLSTPAERPTTSSLTLDEVTDMAASALRSARATGHLPASVLVRGGEVGLGSVALAVAEAWLAPRESVTLRAAPPWPAVAEGMDTFISRIPGWPCHSDAMDVSRLLHWSRLMSWTICPAVAAGGE